MPKLSTETFEAVHIKTREKITALRIAYAHGVIYLVFWKDDPTPSHYTPQDFRTKFTQIVEVY